MAVALKDWNSHVADAEEIARSPGFGRLAHSILELASLGPDDVALDIGSGTGLLTLPAAASSRRVWALDISPAMAEYLRAKTASAEIDNVEIVVGSAVSLPLVDQCVDVVISNYCLHHLDDEGKRRALAEAYRVLRPGGRMVFGDMMFRVSVGDPRDRAVLMQKVRALLAKGPAGLLRLLRNALRFASGRWERPARAEWWREALAAAGFERVVVNVLEHEGGIAFAQRP